MEKLAIGHNLDLEYRFKRASKQVNTYLNNVNKQLSEYDLKISVSELLSNPKKAIRNAYISKHELPKWANETMLLDNFTFDFTYIDSIFNKPNNEIYSAFNTFKCDENGLIQPDFNYYATTKEQIELFNELQAICEAINGFHLKYQRKLPTYPGLMPKAFQNLIETDISKLPLLKVNGYRVSQFQK